MAAIPRQRYCETRKGKMGAKMKEAHLVEFQGSFHILQMAILIVDILTYSGWDNTSSFLGQFSASKQTDRRRERIRRTDGRKRSHRILQQNFLTRAIKPEKG